MGSNPTLSAIGISDCEFRIADLKTRWQSRVKSRCPEFRNSKSAIRISSGEVQEWLNWQHWKCCERETVPWVRIPPSPPCLETQEGENDDAAAMHMKRSSRMTLRFFRLLLALSLLSVVGSGEIAREPVRNVREARSAATLRSRARRPQLSTPNDLPFRVPQNSVIFDTELFYAVILKSVTSTEDDCNVFVPESERLQTQALFPDRKVFRIAVRATSRILFYTNVDPKYRIMAVYAGTTLARSEARA